MLRSDLMLESGCPELSPRARRPAAGEDVDVDTATAVGTAAGTGGGKAEAEAKEQEQLRIRKSANPIQSAYCCWKQVEINTIASGFGHLGPASKTIQRCCVHHCHHHLSVLSSHLSTEL